LEGLRTKGRMRLQRQTPRIYRLLVLLAFALAALFSFYRWAGYVVTAYGQVREIPLSDVVRQFPFVFLLILVALVVAASFSRR
jgi:membrane protease YdiL (CAAX protease family)